MAEPEFRHRSQGITPLIPLPPSLPAKRGEKGEMRAEVRAGGEAARPLTHTLCFPLPTPLCGVGRGQGVGLLRLDDGTAE